jgi:two-component system cell cycle sensor histidine kinase/response regulator CckA
LLNVAASLESLDRIGEGIFYLDTEGRLASLNRTAQLLLSSLLGTGNRELLGSVIWDCAPSLAHTPLGEALRRAQSQSSPVITPLRDPRSGGLLELRAYPSSEGTSVLLLQRVPARAAEEVLDRVDDLFLACNPEWRLTLVNARAVDYLRLAGEQTADLVGRTVWEVVPGLTGSRFQAEAFRAIAEQTEVEFEARFAPLDRWFLVRITPTPEGIVVCARDVTGSRQAERALAREAERLAAVIDTQQAVATAGPDLGAVMRAVTERVQALTQAEATAILLPDDGGLCICEGSGLARAHIGLRVDSEPSLALRCYRTGELLRSDDVTTDERVQRNLMKTLRGRSGVVVPLQTHAGVQAVLAIWSTRPHAFNDLHENTLRLVAGLLSAAMERASAFAANEVLLGERTAAVTALQAGQQRFRTLVDSIDDVVFRLDIDQRCLDIFGRWLEREGFRPEQFLGRTTADIVGPEDAHFHYRANLRALSGETVTYEWDLQTRRGTRHMQTTLSPLRGDRGEITGIVGVGRDITQRIEQEQQVRQAQKMEVVGRFAGGVAHDLNNMMMIILGFSDFLLTNLDRNDPRWSDADEIRKAAERAMHLTRQLLGFGRQRVVTRQVLSLNGVVSGMERMLRPLLGEDITLVTRLSPGLGAVEADYGQLEQVVMNLALNARDAMRGGGRLRIETLNLDWPADQDKHRLGVELPEGPYVMLVVSDTGHGMSPEVKAHLFEPFFTTKAATQNTGLGLATIYGIVVHSGGYIWVESEPEQGTTFKVCLPRVPSDETGNVDKVTPSEPPGGSETILLVEDEEAVRTLASRVLTGQGYVVLEACHGGEALAIAEEAAGVIDLVLTDVIMPEMGGQELVERITRILPAVRVMYMSGYTEADKLQPGIRDSEYPFLQKPFAADSLILMVRDVLDRATN